MPTSVRIDEETEALLEQAARLKAATKSALIRLALKQYCTRLVIGKPLRPYDSIKERLGCAEGPRDLARHARRYLQEALRGQTRRRPH